MGFLIYGPSDPLEVYERISAYYEQLGSESQETEKLIRHSAVYIKQGDLLMDRHDLEGAWQRYQKALELAEQANQRDPDNVESQSYLSINHERLGDVLAKRGNLDGALAAYRTDLPPLM